MAKRKDGKSEPPSIDAKTGRGEQVAEEAAEVGGHVARALEWITCLEFF